MGVQVIWSSERSHCQLMLVTSPSGSMTDGREFAAEFWGFGRDVDHSRFVHVGDPDADGNVVEPPAVVHGSRPDGVGALGLEVEVLRPRPPRVGRSTC